MGQKLNRVTVLVLTILFTATTTASSSSQSSVNDKLINSSERRLRSFRRSLHDSDRRRSISNNANEDNHQLVARETIITTATTTTATNLTAIRLANEHFIEIRTKYRCRVPRPKLIRVKDFYDVPSKEYLPRCTVLHQCDDESGCCEVGTMRCAPQQTQTIALHFYVIEVGVRDNKSGASGSTETLAFVNHTKCHCIEINYMPRNIINSVEGHSSANAAAEQETTTMSSALSSPHTDWSVDDAHSSDPSTQYCKWVDCPKPFSPRLRHSDQRCVCDCFDRDLLCIRVKRGVNRLESTQARCVRGGICLEPECDRGGTFNKYDAICVIPKHRKHAQRHQHHKTQHWLAERD